MIKIVLDQTLRDRLHDLVDQIELCDEHGATLGHVLPDDAYRSLVCGSLEVPFSDAEIERRLNEHEGQSLAQILTELGRV